MSFLFDHPGFPRRRPAPGGAGPFPRFHARLADAEGLLAWGVAGERPPLGGPASPRDPGDGHGPQAPREPR